MTKVQQIIFLLIFSIPSFIQAQDVHFTQYSFAPSLVSPALSGAFDSEFRGGALYRKQWTQVPVNYSSFLGYFDKKVLRPIYGNTLAYGASFQYDQAGDAGLGLMQIKLNGAISRQLHPFVAAAVGFGIGYSTRQYNPDKLTFGSQFSDAYHAELTSGEIFDRTSIGYLDMAAGAHVNLNFFNKYKIQVGGSLAHFNLPEVNFQNTTVVLPTSVQLFIFGNGYLSDKTDLLFNSVYRNQLTYNELVISTGLKYYLNKETNRDLAISILMGIRQKDAFFPEMHLYYKNWTGGLSYDINTSDFKVATAGKGGPELSITYIANTIVPPKKTKLCPIF